MAELRGIFPVTWKVTPNPIWFYQELIYNWLDIEIDMQAEQKMPELKKVEGWRNREVYDFIKHDYIWSAVAKEWVRKIYGKPYEI